MTAGWRAGIRHANRVRSVLAELRRLAYTASPCPLPALEMLIAEMLAIHFCSDREECLPVLEGAARRSATARCGRGKACCRQRPSRVFWVNPVADLRAMNLLEECGGRVCGTEYPVLPCARCHPRGSAAAGGARADGAGRSHGRPGAGPAERICRDIAAFGAEAVIISRIPGASHCALEGTIIAEVIRQRLGMPVIELEVPPVLDAMRATLQTRIEALLETVTKKDN